MAWRNYEVRGGGDVHVVNEQGGLLPASYATGLVLTGKTRVFAGYFVKLALSSGTEFTGEDSHSLRSALLRLASNLSAVRLALDCAGLDPRWRESGLSENTGYGYFIFHPEAVHMMAAVPAISADHDPLDEMIAEAVSRMRIGW